MSDDLRRPTPAAPRRSRRGYLDWVRGIAVLIMIEAHVVDSWTAAPDRLGKPFAWTMVLGGFGAPLFLFLAGVAVALSAGSKLRRTHDIRSSSLAVARRGLEIFALAFVFRVQAWILGWSSVRTLLRVDVLNVMGPSIVLTALLWGVWSSARARAVTFLAATLATAFLTPIVRSAAVLAALPDPIEGYIRPVAGITSFALMPWMAFVLAGGLLGVLLDGVTPAADASSGDAGEGRLNLAFAAGAALIAVTAYAASFLPSPYAHSEFWTSSPAFFFLRLGMLTTTVALAYAWERRPGGAERWSPLRQLGRTSLFIYWIHVEMVYGLLSLPLHHALTLQECLIGLALFSLFMLGCSVWKERAVASWQKRRTGSVEVRTPA